ncbi:Squamosa promoter-binding-like protein [Asimina triloba]
MIFSHRQIIGGRAAALVLRFCSPSLHHCTPPLLQPQPKRPLLFPPKYHLCHSTAAVEELEQGENSQFTLSDLFSAILHLSRSGDFHSMDRELSSAPASPLASSSWRSLLPGALIRIGFSCRLSCLSLSGLVRPTGDKIPRNLGVLGVSRFVLREEKLQFGSRFASEVGAQVAPVFMQQSLLGRFCEGLPVSRKRDIPWEDVSFQQPQQQLWANHWDPKLWDWDSSNFAARPAAQAAEALRMGPAEVAVGTEARRREEEARRPLTFNVGLGNEDGDNLALKLGGGSSNAPAEMPIARPNKRVCSGSVGGGGSYPMCQVDDCRTELSNSKDYHRRHKVCEHHSKAATALVGKQMQRFCQQCSRFHLLSEFDEGKRSCRRRLAGHNRRRRKMQPDDASSQLLAPGNQERKAIGEMDIINVLTILARLQGTNADKITNSQLADGEHLLQILAKLGSITVSKDSAKLPMGFDLNVTAQSSSETPSKMNTDHHAPSTTDLLAVLSAAFAASSPNPLRIFSQKAGDIKCDDKANANSKDQGERLTLQKKDSTVIPSSRKERSNLSFQSPLEVSDSLGQEAQTCLPMRLFSSSPGNGSPPNSGSSRKYFSSESSNPMEERSPSSSPVVRKLFPLNSTKEIMNLGRELICREDTVTVEAAMSNEWSSALELFKGSNGRAENNGISAIPYRAGYSSSSGSDYSPSSSNSDSQDRTGRIMFKLFDKDPSNFPGSLRTQLQEDLSQRVGSLIKGSDSDFWRTGRFLVHTDRQLASHKDGKVRLCKSWKSWTAPELVSVSPIAFEGGKETTLILRGRNLTVPGTKIHCTYEGGYVSKEVMGSYSGTIYDDCCLESFNFPGGAPNVLGRCFIEVENGFKGNSFPVILADTAICWELRILEFEFEEDSRKKDMVLEDPVQDFERPRSREDILHFLNELGWLFQRKSSPDTQFNTDFPPLRFKLLFTFSVERDWLAVVKTLLDLFVEGGIGRDGLSQESMEALLEVQLLSRAVKRKCRKMVDLLLCYFVVCGSDASKKYLFPPNSAGPGGVTPLHLAACTQGSEDMVDALTSDPQEIGLKCWKTLLDANGHSPHSYAMMRNHHSYNRLVTRKLADRRNSQVSIPISSSDVSLIANPGKQNIQDFQKRNCALCAVAPSRKPKLMPGAQGLLRRPYTRVMLAIAAVCVCVCLFLRGCPDIGSVAPFKWENAHVVSIWPSQLAAVANESG